MSEIAKCPICGKRPVGVRWSLGPQVRQTRDNQNALICCGHMIRYAQWNKYAAAMELAKAEVRFNTSRYEEIAEAMENIRYKNKRVLEVFNG